MINKLRKMGTVDGHVGWYSDSDFNRQVETIEDILYEFGKEVESDFRDGGRWSTYETTVYELEQDGEVAYFLVDKERPATESQEGMDLSFTMYEVEPVEITVTRYKPKGE